MPNVVFSHASGSVTFTRNPRRPRPQLSMLQASAESAAGRRFGYDEIATEESIVLHWPRMATADLDALRAFHDVVAGAGESWIWTDVAGVQTAVRFAPGEISAEEIAYGSYAVSVTLMRT